MMSKSDQKRVNECTYRAPNVIGTLFPLRLSRVGG